MEGQRNLEMSLNFGGNANNVSCRPEDDPNRHFVMGAGRCWNQPNAVSSPQWTHLHKASRNYVEFLGENSTFLENASGADMLETITSTVGGTQSVEGLSEIQRELLFNNPGTACGYGPADPSFDVTAWQNHTEQPYEDNSKVSQLPPRITDAPSFFLPKQRRNVSKQKAAVSDRHRRMRIAEKLRSLRELLPHSTEGNQAAILDGIIDHIKFLQLQIKVKPVMNSMGTLTLQELSQSFLGGQPTSKPFIFLEGYGHYVISEQMTNESLEEMMGKLLESNPAAAIKLLESKGLYMMPMALADESGQPS